MISVILPATDNEPALLDTLTAFVAAVAEGVVRDLVIVSSAPSDLMIRLADAAGCALLHQEGARDRLIAAGARTVKCEWSLVVAPGLIPSGDWMRDVMDFINAPSEPRRAGLIDLASKRSFSSKLQTGLINLSPLWTRKAHPWQGLLAQTATLCDERSQSLIFTRLDAVMLDRRQNRGSRKGVSARSTSRPPG